MKYIRLGYIEEKMWENIPEAKLNAMMEECFTYKEHAADIMSKHPGVKAGYFEIRPAGDINEMLRQSEKRRGIRFG